MMGFQKALEEMDKHKTVSCEVLGGDKVVYKPIPGEGLEINGKIHDVRDFCFSPTQILFGVWKIE